MNLPDSIGRLDSLSAGFPRLLTWSPWAVLLGKVTLVLAAAWLLHHLLTKANPRWRVVLWRGMAIGLLMLIAWSLGLPGLEVRIAIGEPAAVSAEAVAGAAVARDLSGPWPAPAIANEDAALSDSDVLVMGDVASSAHGSAAAGSRRLEKPFDAAPPFVLRHCRAILVSVWIFGMALLVSRLAIGYLRLQSIMRISQVASDDVVAVCRRIAVALGCRRNVTVLCSRHFVVPFLFGFRHPVIVLPARICEPYCHWQLSGILAHELAHVRSSDFAWNIILQAVSILFWFHPLAWRIGMMHQAACDEVCDAVSASYIGDVAAYCRTLALVALDATGPLPSAGLTMARSCDVRRRIASLDRKVFGASLEGRVVAGVTLLGVTILLLLASVRFAAVAQAEGDEGQAKVAAETSENVLNASPPPTQDAHIDADLEILRNYSVGKGDKVWATAIRDLIEIGKPAVPRLIEELDRTERPQTLSALGFVMRGIGDPHAVPALIRAIPRLYPCGEIDSHLSIEGDPELTEFMFEHDNYPKEHPSPPKPTFAYGRPIWEIMTALEKISGQSHDWLELSFAVYEGQGTRQQSIKRTTFLKYAERWAQWWTNNWQKYVPNEAQAQLGLTRSVLDRYANAIAATPRGNPLSAIPCGSNAAVGVFFVNGMAWSFDEPYPGKLSKAFRDLDSGRCPVPPPELIKGAFNGEPSQDLLAWAENENVDLITVKTKLPGSELPVYAFKTLGMKVWRIDNALFDNLPNELSKGDKGEFGKTWNGPLAQIDETTGKFDNTLTVSFLFITNEGICGAIRIHSPLSQPVVAGPSPHGVIYHFRFIYERSSKVGQANSK